MNGTFKDLVDLVEEQGLSHLDEAQRTMIATLGLRYLVRLGEAVNALPDHVKASIDEALRERFKERDEAEALKVKKLQMRYTFWGTVVASGATLVSAVVMALLS